MGVITGLMGSGKTTLLCHLFGTTSIQALVLLNVRFEIMYLLTPKYRLSLSMTSTGDGQS